MVTQTRFRLSILALTLAALACQISVGGPEKPALPSQVSSDSEESLTHAWEQAFEQASETGTVTLTLTESQVTAFLATKLAEQEDPLFSDPLVYLRNGQLQIYGKVHRGFLAADARVVINVTLDEEGGPKLELAAADFGPWPVPDGLLSGFSSTLDEALTGNVVPVATGLRIEGILIADGVMEIAGRVK